MTGISIRNKIIACCCWAILMVCSATFVSCSHDSDYTNVDEPADRVVLVYMVAENSLSGSDRFDYADIKEMLSGTSYIPKGDHLIVYLDNTNLPALYDIDRKTDASSYYYLEPVKQWQEDVNSASPEMLDEVLSYVYKHYPAESYGLVMWSHGSGWIANHQNYTSAPAHSDSPARKSKTSFGIDNELNTSSNKGAKMEVWDMAKVLKQYDRLQFVFFDACFMQCIEVAYELRDAAPYIIGSPAEIPAPGAHYGRIMSSLFKHDFNPDDLTSAYFNYYNQDNWESTYGVLLSAIKTSELDAFADVMANIFRSHDVNELNLMNTLNYLDFDFVGVRNGLPDFYDIKGVMQNALSDAEYQEWLAAFNKVVVSSYASNTWYTIYEKRDIPVDHDQYSGVSVFLDLKKYADYKMPFPEDYLLTAWGRRMKESQNNE